MNSMDRGPGPDERYRLPRGADDVARDATWADSARSESGSPEHDAATFDRRLDRLVDGELSGEEYRRFVRSCEERTDGWRRCALAFLEAQAWRQDFTAVRASDSLEARPAEVRPTPAAASPRRESFVGRSGVRWMGVAAGWLLALGLGSWWSSPAAVERPAQLAPLPVGAGPEMLGAVTAPTPRPYVPGEGGAPAAPNEVEFVMTGDHGDWQESKRLPVLSPESYAARHTSDQLSDSDLLNVIRRAGGELRRHQELVPYVLPDGRQIVVPVDRVEVKPVKMPTY